MDKITSSLDRRSTNNPGWGFIIFTMIAGFMLTAIPLPEWLETWRPSWIALLIFYWGTMSPEKVGVVFGFVAGIFLDVFNGGTLGEQALALSMVSLVSTTYSKRFRIYPSFQQSLFVCLIFLIYVFFIRKIQNFDAPFVDGFTPFGEALSSALLWPWFSLVLNEASRRFSL